MCSLSYLMFLLFLENIPPSLAKKFEEENYIIMLQFAIFSYCLTINTFMSHVGKYRSSGLATYCLILVKLFTFFWFSVSSQ